VAATQRSLCTGTGKASLGIAEDGADSSSSFPVVFSGGVNTGVRYGTFWLAQTQKATMLRVLLAAAAAGACVTALGVASNGLGDAYSWVAFADAQSEATRLGKPIMMVRWASIAHQY